MDPSQNQPQNPSTPPTPQETPPQDAVPSAPTVPEAETSTPQSSPESSVPEPTTPETLAGVITPLGNPQPTDAPSTASEFGAPTPTPAPFVASGSMAAPSKGKKKFGLIGLIVGLIVLLGGGVAAFQLVIVPAKTKDMIKKVVAVNITPSAIKSRAYEGELTFAGKDVPAPFKQINFSGAIKGETSKVTLNTPDKTMAVDLVVPEAKTAYARVTVDPRALAALAGGGQAAPDPSLAMYMQMLGGINNQWVSLNSSDASNVSSASLDSFALSEADAKKINDAFGKHIFVKATKMHPDEEIHGIKSKHATAMIDKKELGLFIDALYASKPSFMESMKAADIKDTKDQIAKTNFSKYLFDAWVDLKTSYVTQIKFNMTEKDLTTGVRVAFMDFNKPVDIQKPSTSKSLLELLGAMMAGSTPPSATSPTKIR